MTNKSYIRLGITAFGLSGCLENDAQRGLAGAAGGAVICGSHGRQCRDGCCDRRRRRVFLPRSGVAGLPE